MFTSLAHALLFCLFFLVFNIFTMNEKEENKKQPYRKPSFEKPLRKQSSLDKLKWLLQIEKESIEDRKKIVEFEEKKIEDNKKLNNEELVLKLSAIKLSKKKDN